MQILIYPSLPSTVVLPPEKAEGCESYLQYLHAEDGEREAAREGSKSNGKKRISLNVKPRRLASAEAPFAFFYVLCGFRVITQKCSCFDRVCIHDVHHAECLRSV